jgi:hypothetical protein
MEKYKIELSVIFLQFCEIDSLVIIWPLRRCPVYPGYSKLFEVTLKVIGEILARAGYFLNDYLPFVSFSGKVSQLFV